MAALYREKIGGAFLRDCAPFGGSWADGAGDPAHYAVAQMVAGDSID